MIKKIVNFIAAIFVFFLVLEICARVDDYLQYDAPFFGEYSHNLLHTYDEEGIRCNIPYGRYEKWQNNQYGFRGPDFSLEKEAGKKRIVCMGASETYGLYESPGKEWPAQLAELLSADSSYQVINTSTVGLPVDQFQEYLESYVYKFEPDMAVLVINPLGYVVRLDRLAKMAKQPTPTPQNRPQQTQKATLSSYKPELRVLPKTKQMLKRFLPLSLVEKYQRWDINKKTVMMEERYLKGGKPFDVIPDESIIQFRTEVEGMVKSLQTQGIQVVLSSSPSLLTDSTYEQYPILFMEGRRFSVELSLKGMVDATVKADSVMRLIAQDYATGFLDYNSLIPKNTDYYADLVHFTNAGAEIVAGRTAKYITQESDL